MVFSLKHWDGKVAVVTGASSGIGAAIARELVNRGIIVAGIARRIERIEELSEELADAKGKLFSVKADLANEGELVNALQWVQENVGQINILVNNAGVCKETQLSEGKTEDWKAMFDVNVMALSIATREVLKLMRANNIVGHIININSIVGHRVYDMEGLGMYQASKFAVTGLTEALRQELNHLETKIKITSISPGLVSTEMTVENDGERARQLKAINIPLLHPEDIADGVVYVLSTPEHVQVHELTIKPIGELQ